MSCWSWSQNVSFVIHNTSSIPSQHWHLFFILFLFSFSLLELLSFLFYISSIYPLLWSHFLYRFLHSTQQNLFISFVNQNFNIRNCNWRFCFLWFCVSEIQNKNSFLTSSLLIWLPRGSISVLVHQKVHNDCFFYLHKLWVFINSWLLLV